jgi:hypothetical protein
VNAPVGVSLGVHAMAKGVNGLGSVAVPDAIAGWLMPTVAMSASSGKIVARRCIDAPQARRDRSDV